MNEPGEIIGPLRNCARTFAKIDTNEEDVGLASSGGVGAGDEHEEREGENGEDGGGFH